MIEKKEIPDTEIIKRLLIVQLVRNEISIRDIVKITWIGTKKLYEFLPKNIGNGEQIPVKRGMRFKHSFDLSDFGLLPTSSKKETKHG